jgi:hypothetical protein
MCMPQNKVLIFTAENEGKKQEQVNFKLLEIEHDWLVFAFINISISGVPSHHSKGDSTFFFPLEKSLGDL